MTVPVHEGSASSTERVEWSGNAVLPLRDLDGLMPLKAGELANVSKLDDGLRKVSTAYGRKGYILARTISTPRLDDATRRAVFAIAIEEGPQFRFGTLTFPGLAPHGVEILTRLWRLKTGDVFDASYPSEFFGKEVLPRVKAGTPVPSMQTQVDEKAGVVNIRFVFGG